MTSTAYLVVLLLDINDNPPEFERALYRVTVSEGAGVGDSLARVYAASRDTGVNAQITYAITTGNEQGCFSVTPKSGEWPHPTHVSSQTRQSIMLVCRWRVKSAVGVASIRLIFAPRVTCRVMFQLVVHQWALAVTSPSL